jgi:putative peptidoglycan lipid II flippase
MASALGRMAFFVVPSAAVFLLLGDVVAAALLQTGRFDAAESRYAWYLLAGSAVGLLASTQGRLYASAFYALKDTRTPLAFSVVRVGLGAVLAWWSALHLPASLGLPAHLGGVGITLASGLAAWAEYALLRRALTRRAGEVGLPRSRLARLWACALAGGVAGLAAKAALVAWRGADPAAARELGGTFLQPPAIHPWLTAVAVLGSFGVAYLLASLAMGIPEATAVLRRVWRRRG